LPLSFESNQGQTNAKVRFLSRSAETTLFLTPTEAVFTMPLHRSAGRGEQNTQAAEPTSRLALRMQMVGADAGAGAVQQDPQAGRVNYFIGKDPGKWHTGVPTFGRVGFHQVYPGVDVVYYGNEQRLEYDFVVAPHADSKQIRLHFGGAQSVRVDGNGDLLVRTQNRELQWKSPTVYQQQGASRQKVTARFQLKRLPNGQADVTFALGHYDADRALVIDPVLLYATFLGGASGSSGTRITADAAGNAYITGRADAGDFPVTPGAYETARPFSSAFVTKLNPTGSALVYSTFLGGNTSGGEFSAGIAVDDLGNAYITGTTASADYPTTPGAFQTTRPNQGAGTGFVTKLNPTGTGLVYSTYLGGSVTEKANAIALDKDGNAYITGQAYSLNFPTTPGSFQPAKAANPFGVASPNAFVSKLNSTGSALVYSTYLAGTGTQFSADLGVGIAVDADGNAYVTGHTSSQDFPTTPGAYQTTNTTVNTLKYIGFVTKFNPTGSALVYSTLLGGTLKNYDSPTGIALDSSGSAYVTGFSYNSDFPVTPGAFQTARLTQDATGFVTKFNATGTALVYSTFLGGSGRESAQSIAVDAKGNVAVAGQTFSSNFPTTQGVFQRNNRSTSGGNGFVTELNTGGSALLYSTYLGGSTADNITAVAFGGNGSLFVTGETSSIDLPTTPGAYQTTKTPVSGFYDAFVARLSPIPTFPDFNNDGLSDLLIQNASTGAIASWFMQGSRWTGGAFFSLTPPTEYALVGIGDFSRNGVNQLVLQSRVDGRLVFWNTAGTNNATIAGGAFVDALPYSGWKVVGVGDFNGDGKSDLLFQSQATNQVAVWFMDGALYKGGLVLPFTPPVGWTVAGVGDLNFDGFPDIVFQNQTSGQIALWYMNHTNYIGGTILSIIPVLDWKVVGVADYNGDGSADLLFQNQTTNQAAVWYLLNGGFVGGDVLSVAPPAGWKIVGPR
jgi:hypothetical protein